MEKYFSMCFKQKTFKTFFQKLAETFFYNELTLNNWAMHIPLKSLYRERWRGPPSQPFQGFSTKGCFNCFIEKTRGR